ncbi:mucin-associated surface protein (MASP) [Trypanosoma cruzi]|nr:mucin-associated surface protein (MASP) [Trypanosoma cruzi]
MYRCRPAVPLAVLMCLPVLLFSASPSHTHTHISICTVLCKKVFALPGMRCSVCADAARWPPLTMTVAVPSEHTSTNPSLSLCGSGCSRSVVYGSGSWCLGEGRGAEEQEGEPAGRD